MLRFLTVLYKSVGQNVIAETLLRPQMPAPVRSETVSDVSDANNHPLKTVGTMDLVLLRLGTSELYFIARQSLAAPVLLRFDYCNRFVNDIGAHVRRLERDGGSSVPIVCRSMKHASQKQFPLLAVQ